MNYEDLPPSTDYSVDLCFNTNPKYCCGALRDSRLAFLLRDISKFSTNEKGQADFRPFLSGAFNIDLSESPGNLNGLNMVLNDSEGNS